MDTSEADQREEHRQEPNVPVTLEALAAIGVHYWKLDPAKHEDDPELEAIRTERGYSYQDIISVAKDTLPNYEVKIKSFFEEHMHTDEEVRYILDGSGYFDVRNKGDAWIRIKMEAGDLIVLPAGIYHRFTLDTTNFIKAMRLFVGEPVWTPHNRPQDDHPIRKKYVEGLVAADEAAAAAGDAATAESEPKKRRTDDDADDESKA